MDRVIGIDLGTSNASVAAVKDGAPVVIPDDQGRILTPAVVSYPEDGEPIVGLDAKRRRLIDPARTVYGVKRLLGRDADDPVIKSLSHAVPYTLVPCPSGKVGVEIGENVYSPSEVASVLITHLKAQAEAFLGGPVSKAVIAVPACASDAQRLAFRLAAQMAGLDVLRIVSAPAAATLLHAHGAGLQQRVAVYAFGGGCFDAAVLDVRDHVVQVRAVAGDTMVGGDEFDRLLYEALRSRFLAEHGLDLATDVVATQRLLNAAENSKIHLSENTSVEVRLREMAYGDNGPLDLMAELTREEITTAGQDVVRRTLALCDQALKSARTVVGDLDAVLLVGGATRVPLVAEAAARYFKKAPLGVAQDDGAVALGAALYARQLLDAASPEEKPGSLISDVLPSPWFVKAGGREERLFARNSPIPSERRCVFTTSTDDQERLHVQLLQGEGTDGQRRATGEFVVEGLRSSRRGEGRVEVSFEMDCDGVLNVSATDLATGTRSSPVVRAGAESLEQDVVLLRLRRGEVRA
ncbi:MAG: Hsp70 family protein [Myxococcota bacterium]